MKKIIIFWLVLLTVTASAQNKSDQKYKIEGQLANASKIKVFITADNKYSDFRDSTMTNERGQFSFTGKVLEPQPFTLQLNAKGEAYRFLVDNTKISINGDSRSIKSAHILGGKQQLDYEEYRSVITTFQRYQASLNDSLLSERSKLDSTELLAKWKMIQTKLKDSVNNFYETFVRRHPGSAVSVYLMNSLVDNKPISISNNLMQLIEKTPAGKYPSSGKLRTLLNTKLRGQEGASATDFSQPDTAGRNVRLSDFKGKYVFVDFWASWCVPCRKENPNVLAAYEKFKDQNLVIIGVSIDAVRAQWLRAIKEDKLPWLQLSDLRGVENQAAKIYGISAIPSNFLVDPNGKIIGANLRGKELEMALEQAINHTGKSK